MSTGGLNQPEWSTCTYINQRLLNLDRMLSYVASEARNYAKIERTGLVSHNRANPALSSPGVPSAPHTTSPSTSIRGRSP